MAQTITGLFDRYEDARTAVAALQAAGVPRDDISIIANDAHGEHAQGLAGADAGSDAAKGAEFGAAAGGIGGLFAGVGLLAIPGLGPVAAAGWLVSAVVGAVGGAAVGAAAGGLVGALVHVGVPEEHAHVYAEGVRRGGTLVTAKVGDGQAAEARSILAGERSVDIAARRSLYVQEGWSRFDSGAAPYGPEEVAAERARYDRF